MDSKPHIRLSSTCPAVSVVLSNGVSHALWLPTLLAPSDNGRPELFALLYRMLQQLPSDVNLRALDPVELENVRTRGFFQCPRKTNPCSGCPGVRVAMREMFPSGKK